MEETTENVKSHEDRFIRDLLEMLYNFMKTFNAPPDKLPAKILYYCNIKNIRSQIILGSFKQVLSSGEIIPMEFIDLSCESIVQSFNSKHLVKKILDFDNYRVSIGLLAAALSLEARPKGKKYFNDEQKSLLFTVMFNQAPEPMIFFAIRMFLKYASVVPEDFQRKMFFKYIEIFSKYVSTADLFIVYKESPDLLPELRYELAKHIVRALNTVFARNIMVKNIDGMEIFDLSQNSNSTADDKDKN